MLINDLSESRVVGGNLVEPPGSFFFLVLPSIVERVIDCRCRWDVLQTMHNKVHAGWRALCADPNRHTASQGRLALKASAKFWGEGDRSSGGDTWSDQSDPEATLCQRQPPSAVCTRVEGTVLWTRYWARTLAGLQRQRVRFRRARAAALCACLSIRLGSVWEAQKRSGPASKQAWLTEREDVRQSTF